MTNYYVENFWSILFLFGKFVSYKLNNTNNILHKTYKIHLTLKQTFCRNFELLPSYRLKMSFRNFSAILCCNINLVAVRKVHITDDVDCSIVELYKVDAREVPSFSSAFLLRQVNRKM
jgi:hypothetical protein